MKLKQLFENEVPNITDPYEAYRYARNQGKRIPELEPVIMKNPKIATLYTHDVIEERWPEAEPYIMKDPTQAYFYAQYIIKGVWPEAEPHIMKDPYWANVYLRAFPEARTPSKDIPLVLGDYAIMDVPNTITDEQVLKLIKIIEPEYSRSNEYIISRRTYIEPSIKERLAEGRLKQTTTNQLMNNKIIRTSFLNSVGWDYSYSDFE